MAWRSDAGINDDRNSGLLDDDAEEVSGLQSFIGSDRCAERHHCSRTCLLEMFTKSRVSLAVWKHYESEFDELFRGL